MSDAYSAMSAKQTIYDEMIKTIKESDINDLCELYNVQISDDVLQLAGCKDFKLERITKDYWEGNRLTEIFFWKLSVRIPGARSYCESFISANLSDVTTRCIIFVLWGNTESGKKAIESYLD